MTFENIDHLCVNTLRTLSIDAIEKANSGHPGLPLGAAPMMYVLWQKHLNFNPTQPSWAQRDRFILSPGHGSALMYSMLHCHGFDVTLDDMKNFRQWRSKTAGHPEQGLTPGVEATTGPLGQGCAMVVGMAMAERFLAHRFNRSGHTLVDHFTYALISDGDVMEGISAEAASLAGHYKLGKLICLYDANDVCLDGPLSLTFTENIAKRYESYNWHVQTVHDGDTDLQAIDQAIIAAKANTTQPSIIIVKTTIGFGSPKKAGTAASHGAPLGSDEVQATKKALGWESNDAFDVPKKARAHFSRAGEAGRQRHDLWKKTYTDYTAAYPDLAKQWRQAMANELPPGWDNDLPRFKAGEKIATRAAGGQALNAIAKNVPWFFGGDADLSCSTKTAIKDGGSFDGQTGSGKNIHFGVREHAMGAVMNGMAHHGGVRTYTATFFCFSDYMRPAIRLAALDKLPSIFVFTHDSIGVGEDGPTHQPVEHLAALRCMPGVHVVRPGDANETTQAWQYAMKRNDGPTVLVLSRQNLMTLDQDSYGSAVGLHRGAYILSDVAHVQAVILATGSEVEIALRAQEILASEGVLARVVSVPCFEAFNNQDLAYQALVLPKDVKARVAIEAAVGFGWEQYLGDTGVMIGVEGFGTSAPAPTIYEQYGLTAQAVVDQVRGLLSKTAIVST